MAEGMTLRGSIDNRPMTESTQPENIYVPALTKAKEALVGLEAGGTWEAQQSLAQVAQAYALVSIAESLASLDKYGIKTLE